MVNVDGTNTGGDGGQGSGTAPDVPDPGSTTTPGTGGEAADTHLDENGNCCYGVHDPSVHKALHGGGGGSGPMPHVDPIDANIYVDTEGLQKGGQDIWTAADGMATGIKAALDRVLALNAANPAGDDAAGKAFHKNYDEPSRQIAEGAPKIAEGIKILGAFAEQAAVGYATFDDQAADAVYKVTGK